MPIGSGPMRRLALVLAVAAASNAAANPELPRPATLEPNVAFWTRVYTEVDTSGGLIHDAEHLGVVYEVLRFPVGLAARVRERRVEASKDRYRAILRKLERGERAGLSEEEQRVLALWPEGSPSQVFQRAAGQLRFQLGQADKFRAGLARSGQWVDHIEQTLREHGVPLELSALPHVESSFNPRAYSRVGAAGLWQFTRGTGRRYMRVDEIVDERMDPHKATVGAARLLRDNYRRLEAWPLAITAYNHGAAGMDRAVRTLGTRDIGVISRRYQSRIFGFASRNFYAEFLAADQIHRDPERYFGPITPDPPVAYEILVTDAYFRAPTLGRALGIDLDVLRDHNLALRPAVWNGAKHVPKGYALRIPRSELRRPLVETLAAIPQKERLVEQQRDRFHKVRRGETLSVIARRYGVRERELVAVNGLRSRNRIRAGQILRLPTQLGLAPEPVVVASASPEPAASPPQAAAPAEPVVVAAAEPPPVPVAAAEPPPVPVAAAEPPPVPVAEAEPAPAPVAEAEPPVLVAAAEPPPVPVAAAEPRRGAAEAARPVAAPQIGAPDHASPPAAVVVAEGLDAAGPEAVPAYYEVRRGDTLSRIAARFGLSERELVARNGLRDRHRIAAGQRLRVAPGAAAAATPELAPTPAPPAEPPAAPARPLVVAEASPEVPPPALPDEPAVVVGVEEGVIEAGEEPGAEDALLAEAVVVETPAAEAKAAKAAAPDPSDYAVTADQRITVHADETIGHYAEWLEVSASRLRQLNRMQRKTPLVIGRQRKLDFSRVTPEAFEQRRLEYHRTLQEEYFEAFEVTATTTHVLGRGDTLWQLSRQRYQIPMWLLVHYNPDLDFGSLAPGTQLVIPVVESRQGG
jgi:membrane-bound lytic murein transglycosylase D